MRLAALLLVVAACGSEKKPLPTEHQIEVEMARHFAQTQLPKIHKGIEIAEARTAKPVIDDVDAAQMYSRAEVACALASGSIDTLATVADPLLFELARLCQHELPTAVMRAEVAVVEADHPDRDGRLTSCGVATMVFDDAVQLRNATGEPDVSSLRARIDQRCGVVAH